MLTTIDKNHWQALDANGRRVGMVYRTDNGDLWAVSNFEECHQMFATPELALSWLIAATA